MSILRRRGPAVLAIVAAAAVMLLAWSQTWFELRVDDGAGGHETLPVGGDAAGGAVLAIALATAAVAAVLAIAGPRMRIALGIVIALLGIGALGAAVAVLADPSAVFERVVGESTGIGGEGALSMIETAAPTVWPVVAAIAGALGAVLGAAVALFSRRWGVTGRRYERGDAAPAAGGATPDAVDAWDAISHGDDPTDGRGPDAPSR